LARHSEGNKIHTNNVGKGEKWVSHTEYIVQENRVLCLSFFFPPFSKKAERSSAFFVVLLFTHKKSHSKGGWSSDNTVGAEEISVQMFPLFFFTSLNVSRVE